MAEVQKTVDDVGRFSIVRRNKTAAALDGAGRRWCSLVNLRYPETLFRLGRGDDAVFLGKLDAGAIELALYFGYFRRLNVCGG